MGVRGLASYVEAQEQVWETYQLRRTRLVIDGNGFYHYIYCHFNLDCKYGGQYTEFETKVKAFFTKLSSHDVQPYVIFDGVLDESGKKLRTVIERKVQRIQRARDFWVSRSSAYDRSAMILPRLAQLTLIKVLQDLQIPYSVADFEADSDVASLANELHGPVMGLDSDYFIFNIQEGYIPFDKFEFSGSSMTTKRFRRVRLANHLNINPAVLPVLASLVGNDYVPEEILEPFKTHVLQQIGYIRGRSKSHAVILGTANFLSGHNSFKEAMAGTFEFTTRDKNKLQEALGPSVDEYQLKPTHLFPYFQRRTLGSNLHTFKSLGLPEWVIKIYREGGIAEQCMSFLFHRVAFLKVQVEDMSKPSANQCALKIRKFLYEILMKHDANQREEISVHEYDRDGVSFKPRKYALTSTTETAFSNIPAMQKHTKVAYLLKVLSCNLSLVQHLPKPHQLVVAALRYWFTNATPSVTEAHLASILVYYVGMNDQVQRRCREYDATGLQGFAQWQDVVYWVSYLNSIFGNEFPRLDPVRLYDGENVCKIYQQLKIQDISIVDTFVRDIKLYKQLYDAVRPRGEDSVQEFLRGNRFKEMNLSFD